MYTRKTIRTDCQSKSEPWLHPIIDPRRLSLLVTLTGYCVVPEESARVHKCMKAAQLLIVSSER